MALLGLYPTKKALKESIGQALRFKETALAGPEYKPDGEVVVAGPDPENLKWYATVTMKNGVVTSVR